ncbi:MAG: hypothetical protein IKJ26_02440 [Clostridia bacterium]|nr:hypothetical protein [Clostridia bacterium]
MARNQCSCFDSGQCIPQDRPCHVINRLWPERDKRPIACKWFLDGVLPLDKELEKIVRSMQDGLAAPDANTAKPCAACKRPFQPSSNRQQYCSSCADARRKQRRAEAERRRRRLNREN